MRPNQETDLAMDCAALLELIPEYAFGVTEAEQSRLVEASLPQCPEATALLEEYRHLQDELRAGVPQVEPSPELGTRLMAAVAEPIPFAHHSPAPAVTTAEPVEKTSPSKARTRTMRIAWVAAAAAVVALVLTNIYWFTRVNALTESQAQLTTMINAQNSGNAFVLTNTDSLHWVRLPDTQEGDAAAFMMWNSRSKTGLLYARDFPALEPGYTYHLWLTRPNERVFAGIFTVDEDGEGALLFNSPEPIDQFSWAWVTSESPNDPTPNTTNESIVGGELDPA
jgi:anti-sigma-K factor RskA